MVITGLFRDTSCRCHLLNRHHQGHFLPQHRPPSPPNPMAQFDCRTSTAALFPVGSPLEEEVDHWRRSTGR